ncbi:MAG: type II toxin-antitoxin system PemK/MazF family toxin [Chloroflexi bacterium]|nr:type II toxin-antitoxin system PemK/MazF family toxin [Chloroflexota bacterium]
MAYQRGDVVLIPFPYTDLTATKTRPTIVVSSNAYHAVRSELILIYVSSRITSADSAMDYVLTDWKQAGLLKPSFVRPKIAAIEPTLVVHHIGKLSARDLLEVDRRLRKAMDLTETALVDITSEIDLLTQPIALIQTLAEQSVTAVSHLAASDSPDVNIERLIRLLSE